MDKSDQPYHQFRRLEEIYSRRLGITKSSFHILNLPVVRQNSPQLKRRFENMMELPLGFGMALAQNPRAMAYFSRQTEEKQEEILAHTHSIRSRNEMHAYVQSLGNRL